MSIDLNVNIPALEKLIDVASKGIGRATKHHFEKKDIKNEALRIRETAKAKADSIKTISNAINESNIGNSIRYKDTGISITSDNSNNEVDIYKRSQSRIEYQEAKKQLNIESIIANAANELLNEPDVTNEPVDEDWINNFFNFSENISTDDMQKIWGKVLAGEIKNPNSYSLRALDILRKLTKDEANVFLKSSKFVIEFANRYALIFKEVSSNILNSEEYPHILDYISMKEAGIFQNVDDFHLNLHIEGRTEPTNFIYKDILITVKTKPLHQFFNIRFEVLTKSGKELLKLIESTKSIDYLKDFVAYIRKEGYDIACHKINSFDGVEINYEDEPMDI